MPSKHTQCCPWYAAGMLVVVGPPQLLARTPHLCRYLVAFTGVLTVAAAPADAVFGSSLCYAINRLLQAVCQKQRNSSVLLLAAGAAAGGRLLASTRAVMHQPTHVSGMCGILRCTQFDQLGGIYVDHTSEGDVHMHSVEWIQHSATSDRGVLCGPGTFDRPCLRCKRWALVE